MNPMLVYQKSEVEWSDIQSHLQRLRESARGNVFEIGVRDGISTAALLVGIKEHQQNQSSHLWSLDVIDCGGLYDDPDWTFIQGHSVIGAERILKQLPPELDLLFIDSDHSYETTRDELRIYGPLVKKDSGLILMHDTNFIEVLAALKDYAAIIDKVPVTYLGSNGMGELRP